MRIPITLSASSAANPKLPPCLARISHDEVVLIELQGSLQVDSDHPTERDGKHVGKLTIDEATNKPTLIIGHQLLEGKIQALTKPLAVIVRSSSSAKSRIVSANEGDPNDDDDTSMLVDEGDQVPDHSRSTKTALHDVDEYDQGRSSGSSNGLEESGTNWTIVAVVKKKIIFSKRPMPITNKTTN